jgi:hypothetical protein
MHLVLLLLSVILCVACPPGPRGPPGEPAPPNNTFTKGIHVFGASDFQSLTTMTTLQVSTLIGTNTETAGLTAGTTTLGSLSVVSTAAFSGTVLISNIADASSYGQTPALKVDGGVDIAEDAVIRGSLLMSPTSTLGVGGRGLFFGSVSSLPSVNMVNLQLSDTRLLTMKGTPATDLQILPPTDPATFYTLLGGTVTQGFASSPFVTNTTCDFQLYLYKSGVRTPVATGMSNAWFTAGHSLLVVPTITTGTAVDPSHLSQTALTFGPTQPCQVLSGDGSVNVLLLYMTGFA